MPTQKQLPWPATRLSDPEILAQLRQVSIATGKHVTVLLREAAEALVADLRDRMDDPTSLRRVSRRLPSPATYHPDGDPIRTGAFT